jgi:hypothetical protein
MLAAHGKDGEGAVALASLGLREGWAADASACAALLWPIAKMGGAAHLSGSAHVTGSRWQSWKGGSGACFPCIAWLVLVGVGGVLGVVHWQGDQQQCWGVGNEALAFERQRTGAGISATVHWQMRLNRAFAGWRWARRIGRAVRSGHQQWGIGGVVVLSRRQRWRDPTINMRWKEGGEKITSWGWGGGILFVII